MEETARARGQRLARESLARGDAAGWFETLYADAQGNPEMIQWADMEPNPHLRAWLSRERVRGDGSSALVVGCGLGDDARALAEAGFSVVAFDISATAISWCQRRFNSLAVHFVNADLFDSPVEWQDAFDLVLEAYTLQVLPPELRPLAIARISSYVAPDGRLLVICRGRDEDDPTGAMPWPLTRAEVDLLCTHGLRDIRFEDYHEHDESATRRFRVEFRKDSAEPTA